MYHVYIQYIDVLVLSYMLTIHMITVFFIFVNVLCIHPVYRCTHTIIYADYSYNNCILECRYKF